jgi:hypothetical protein
MNFQIIRLNEIYVNLWNTLRVLRALRGGLVLFHNLILDFGISLF